MFLKNDLLFFSTSSVHVKNKNKLFQWEMKIEKCDSIATSLDDNDYLDTCSKIKGEVFLCGH